MAEFFGTSGIDNLVGAAGVVDNFLFQVGHLKPADTVIGGDGPVVDQLSFFQAGTVNARMLGGVSGIEAIRLHDPGIALQLDDAVLARNGGGDGLTIHGSAGADIVRAGAVSGTARLAVLGNDGDDLLVAGGGLIEFVGGNGDDRVRIAGADLTADDTFVGGAGFDVLSISSGAVGAGQLGGLGGFEAIRLQDAISLSLDDTVLARNDDGVRLNVRGSDGSDTVDAGDVTGPRGVRFVGWEGDDRFTGGAGNDIVTGGSGSDTISGGDGRDWAILEGDFADYSLSRLADGRLQVDDGSGNVDVIGTDVERLRFADQTIKSDGAGRLVIDLSTLSASQGFIIQGDAAGDRAGRSVSSAGDVNGDGFDDLIVRADASDDGGRRAGEAYVVFGSGSGFGQTIGGRKVIDLTTLSAAQGFIIQGDAAYDSAGRSVSSAGDVNGDGFDDLIVGARHGDDGGRDAGEAYVVFGSGSGFGQTIGGRKVIDLTTLSPTHGFIVQGDRADDLAGHSVSSAGDVNGDGFDDLIVGAPRGDDGSNQAAGEAYVIFGSGSGFGTTTGGRQVLDLTTLSAAQGFIIQGDAANDGAGQAVSSAGDVNGDGFDDLIVGATGGDDGGDYAGEAYVVFGSGSGFGQTIGGQQVIDLTTLSAAQGFLIQGDKEGDFAGLSISSAGDVNGDGFDDLIVGAFRGDDGGKDAGEAYVVFGSDAGFGTNIGGRKVIDLSTLSPTQGFIIQGDAARDYAGMSASSAGDVNGDGFDDLIVGAPWADSARGEAFVVFGSVTGFGTSIGGRKVIDLATLSAAQGLIVQGDAQGDLAGLSVSSAGDANGDGFDDLIVGASRGYDGGKNAGEAYVVFGGAFGLGDTPVTTVGTSAAEMLIGGLGDDTLTGGGGADVFRSGKGDDVLVVRDTAFADIDAGHGIDTFVFAGAGFTLDLTEIASPRITGLERFDLSAAADHSLVVGADDVFQVSQDLDQAFSAAGSHNTFVVDGGPGDSVTLTPGVLASGSWSLVGDDVGLDGSAGGAYDLYDFTRNGKLVASVAVDADIGLTIL